MRSLPYISLLVSDDQLTWRCLSPSPRLRVTTPPASPPTLPLPHAHAKPAVRSSDGIVFHSETLRLKRPHAVSSRGERAALAPLTGSRGCTSRSQAAASIESTRHPIRRREEGETTEELASAPFFAGGLHATPATAFCRFWSPVINTIFGTHPYPVRDVLTGDLFWLLASLPHRPYTSLGRPCF